MRFLMTAATVENSKYMYALFNDVSNTEKREKHAVHADCTNVMTATILKHSKINTVKLGN